MAKKTVTVVIDDLNGEQVSDGSTVKFALDGTSYEIDLAPENAAKLREALEPYIRAGRRVGARTRPAGRAGSRGDLGDIRAWAKSQGMTVSERGRVAREVIEAYDAAH